MSITTEQYMALSAIAYIDFTASDKGLNIGSKSIYSKIEAKLDSDNDKTIDSTYANAVNSLRSWTLISYQPNTSSGFAAAAFQNPATGEIVFTFRGTEVSLEDSADISVDIGILMQRAYAETAKHLDDAGRFVYSVLNNPKYKGNSYSFTGHSLGGAIAHYMTYITKDAGIPGLKGATTFNAPGIGGVIEKKLGVTINPRDYDDLIIDYVNESDIIGYWRPDKSLGRTQYVQSKLNSETLESARDLASVIVASAEAGDGIDALEGIEVTSKAIKFVNDGVSNAKPFVNHGMDDMKFEDGRPVPASTGNPTPVTVAKAHVLQAYVSVGEGLGVAAVVVGNTVAGLLYYSQEGVCKFFNTSGYIIGGLAYYSIEGVEKFIDTSEYILGGIGYYSIKGAEEFVNTAGNLIVSGLWNGFSLLSRVFSEGMKSIFSLFNSAVSAPRVPGFDPLILDLNGDRNYTINLERSRAYFDLDANGFAERTAWVDPNDALLVLDRDNDGIITSGQELFGDQTILSNGNKAASGFEALAEFDENKDGKIDAKDIVYAKLRLWQDANGDGVSQADELKLLADAGVVAINLNSNVVNSADVMGNVQRRLGSFVRSDGSGGQIAEYLLNRDTLDSLDLLSQNIVIPEDIAALPNLQGTGNMTSLHAAMTKDESGELKRLLVDFLKPENATERERIFADILYKWAKVEEIDPNSRGGLVDAQRLAILEKFMGMKFIGSEGENPNRNAAPLLKKAYSKLFDRLYTHLASGAFLKELLGKIDYKVVESSVVIDLSKVRAEIDAQLATDANIGKQMLSDIVRALNGYDLEEREVVTEFINHFALKSSELAGVVYRICEGAVMGSGNADQLNGTAGNDLLVGGTGNDLLEGGEGNDTYIFSKGDGEDRIFDANGVDTIQFGEGISPDDIVAKVIRDSSGCVNLELSVKGTDDKITVYQHFGNSYNSYRETPDYQIEKVVFADGTTWDLKTIHDKAHNMSGTEGSDTYRVSDQSATTFRGLGDDDTIVGGIANDLLYGDDGDDELRGGAGNDLLYGGTGNDWLYGQAGDDTLVGGTGNDLLEGGEGNDTYIFSKGDGEDRIFDANGVADEVRLGHESIDVVFERVNSSLRVRMPGSLDAITIDSWYNGDAYKIETFKSTDGNVITHTQIESLIQAMASFQNDTGMTWEQALSEQPSQVRSIVQEYWTVPTV